MKTLYIVRHAKSDWNILNLQDIDRSLNTRGYKDAHAMSSALKKKKFIPELIISSPAIRALSTALIFARNFEIDASELQIKSMLYQSSVQKYIDVLHQLPSHYNSVMLFGHNPIITDFANMLTTAFSHDIPTCGIACIYFDCDEWQVIEKTKGVLSFFEFPGK